ncbi:hypothetical protein KAW96_08495 [candidate division WOR-3 bacterium]|nr:hypothetical protein [candidate division WOR-3 bacterium]
MLKFPFHMNPEVEIFLIFPFRLGVKTFPLSASKREEIFPRWAQRLNTHLPEFVWRAIPFDAANPVPSLIRKRKAIYLLGTSQESASLRSWIHEIVKDWGPFEVIEVRESIWYYDWGIGAVDVSIKLIVKEAKELNKLLEFGEGIHDFLKEEQKITLFREWARYAHVLIETFAEGHHIWKYKKEMLDFEFSGKMDAYGINLIVKSACEGALEVSEEELKAMLSSFIGRSVKEQDFVHLPGVFAVAEGYNGQVAVFDSVHPSVDRVIERVRWTWRLVTLYWANLSVLGEFLSKRLIMSFSPGDTKIQEDLECLRRERLGLQLFLHESSPRNFCDDALDLRVYEGVWVAWQGDKLVKEIKEQLEFLQVYFSESVNLLTTELQSRINWILFILNILTFSTVIATLIIIYDLKNEIFLPNWRLLLVIMGTGLFGLLSLLFLVKGRLFKSLKEKR